MTDKLEFFIALAREQHFGCGESGFDEFVLEAAKEISARRPRKTVRRRCRRRPRDSAGSFFTT
jgi:hypothetical protein